MTKRFWLVVATGVVAIAIPLGVAINDSGADTPKRVIPEGARLEVPQGTVSAHTDSGGYVDIDPKTLDVQAKAYAAEHPLPEGSVYSYGFDDNGKLVPMEICTQTKCEPVSK